MVDPAELRALFDRAVSLPPAARAGFLDSACGHDGALRREVDRLLSADAGGASAFDDPPIAQAEPGPSSGATPGAVLLPSGTLLGPYVIESPIGAGGMGQVYRARDTRLGRTVAIKVLPPCLAGDQQARQRFEGEARAVAALSHPHICPLFDVGRQDTIDFLVMEYLTGETLAARLKRGPLPLGETLRVATQMAAALAAAHRSGIVHRDLKPGNVMLTESGVRLLDFGLARQIEAAREEATPSLPDPLTGTGMIVGTLPYMAPEQIEGRPADARTDVFAFGVVLHEMVTGRRAFDGRSQAALIGSILRDDPPLVTASDPRLPPALDRLVRRCIAKNPLDRWATVTDVQARLEALQESTIDSSVDPAGAVPPRKRTLRRVGAGVALLLVTAGAGVAWWWTARAGSAPATTYGPSAARAQRNLKRLTFDPGLQTDPTFSPDGNFVAYASDRAGNFDIWVQPTAGGDAVQVTKSPAQDTEPSWSPDGSTIAFRSERDGGGIYVVQVLGGAERRVSEQGIHPRWSSDAKQIRFHTEGDPQWDHVAGLFAVPLAGGPPHQILPEFTAMGDWSWIGGHPDGRISFLGVHKKLGYGFFTVSSSGKITDSRVLEDIPNDYHGLSGDALLLFEMRWNRRQRFDWNRDGTELILENRYLAATSGVCVWTRPLWNGRLWNP